MNTDGRLWDNSTQLDFLFVNVRSKFCTRKREKRQKGDESRRPTIYRTAETEDHEEGRKRGGAVLKQRGTRVPAFLSLV